AGACATAGWIVAGESLRQFDRGLMTNAANPIPRWWITAVIALGFASASLHFLRHAGPKPK
ncbi:MAG: TRAP transporter small permease, partial [Pseudomonadota bacterium]